MRSRWPLVRRRPARFKRGFSCCMWSGGKKRRGKKVEIDGVEVVSSRGEGWGKREDWSTAEPWRKGEELRKGKDSRREKDWSRREDCGVVDSWGKVGGEEGGCLEDYQEENCKEDQEGLEDLLEGIAEEELGDNLGVCKEERKNEGGQAVTLSGEIAGKLRMDPVLRKWVGNEEEFEDFDRIVDYKGRESGKNLGDMSVFQVSEDLEREWKLVATEHNKWLGKGNHRVTGSHTKTKDEESLSGDDVRWDRWDGPSEVIDVGTGDIRDLVSQYVATRGLQKPAG